MVLVSGLTTIVTLLTGSAQHYNNCIRLVFNLPRISTASANCVMYDVPSFMSIFRKNIFSLMNRLHVLFK